MLQLRSILNWRLIEWLLLPSPFSLDGGGLAWNALESGKIVFPGRRSLYNWIVILFLLRVLIADEGAEEVSQENHHLENQSETGQHVAFSSGDLHKRTVPQLRELAQSYGLSSEGKKRDLIERILSLSTSSEQGEGEVAEQPMQEETVDYSKLTVVELRKELTARGLPTNGKKKELLSST